MTPETPITGRSALQTGGARGKIGWKTRTAWLVFFLLVIAAALWMMQPPKPLPADADLPDASATRAYEHLQVIASDIHPVGTPAHEKVRDYLVGQLRSYGLDPQVQHTSGFYQHPDATFDYGGAIDNIVVRLKGTNTPTKPGQAILLSAHYDSTANSHGASKNGVSVAALLETIRALQAGPPLQNDVIFLFTDGTESFWAGSQAFVSQHPWAKDVGLVFNLEARGSSGPVLMFETSADNGGLIREFAKAVPHPLANSLLSALYKLTPYDTDFTILKQPGVSGLNFAFAEQIQNHRSANDTLAHVDMSTLQQESDNALGLARHFGNTDLGRSTDTQDAVFFSLGQWTLFHYSLSWAWPLTVITLLVFLGACFYGWRLRLLTVKGIFSGFLAALLALIGAAVVVEVLTMGITSVIDPFALTNHGAFYLSGFLLLAVALTAGLLTRWHRRRSLVDLSFGGALLWSLLMLGSTRFLPEGSFYFTWPLLFHVFSHLLWLRQAGRTGQKGVSTRTMIVLSVFALPAVIMSVQLIDLLHILLLLSLPSVLIVLAVLLMALLVPQLIVMVGGAQANVEVATEEATEATTEAKPRRATWRQRLLHLPNALALLAIAVLIVALAQPAFSASSPKPDLLIYGKNDDTGAAYFAAHLNDFDPFLDQYVKSGEASNFGQFYPESLPDKPFRVAEGKAVPVQSPEMRVLSDTQQGGMRELRLQIGTGLPTLNTLVSMTSDRPVTAAKFDGVELLNRDRESTRWEVLYSPRTASGFELTVHLQADQKLKIRLTDARPGFPDALQIQRPAGLVPTYFSDLTYVTKTFSL